MDQIRFVGVSPPHSPRLRLVLGALTLS